MRSLDLTSSEDSRLVRIVVPCAQTRLPGPRGHRDALSSSSERRKRRAFRQACSAGHRASSGVRTSPLHGELEQLLLGVVYGAAFICACALY